MAGFYPTTENLTGNEIASTNTPLDPNDRYRFVHLGYTIVDGKPKLSRFTKGIEKHVNPHHVLEETAQNPDIR